MQAIIAWIDEHTNATVQHIALALAWFVVIGGPITYFWGWDFGNFGAAMWAIAWNSSREERDWEKASGFGWRTFLIPDFVVVVTYLMINSLT